MKATLARTKQEEAELHSDKPFQAALELDCEQSMTPLVTSFVENAATCYGLDPADALDLTLSSEEIFTYLCSQGDHGEKVRIGCRYGAYFVELEFQFKADDFDLAAFNLTATHSLSCGEPNEETGLLIASRLVDRFSFSRKGGVSTLLMIKEKSYPHIQEEEPPQPKILGDIFIRRPDREELKLFVRQVRRYYDPCVTPLSFETPGKVVDMEAFGKYSIAIATDKSGTTGGGIIWTWESDKLVEFFGPYVLDQSREFHIPQKLIEHMIGSIARTSAVGLITRSASPELRTEYFQPMGNLIFMDLELTSCERSCYYRHLQEDTGTSVWAHPLVKSFLEAEYERHFFAREIHTVTDEGEKSHLKSVIAADIVRETATAVLRPVWWGQDDSNLIETYVSTLLNERLFNIFFEMDLGRSWELHFTPGLLERGFQPRIVLPYAGTSDILILQYSGKVEV